MHTPLAALAALLLASTLGPAPAAAAVEPTTIRAAVIRFNFSNDTRSPAPARGLGNVLFNSPDTDGVNRSTAAYVADASYGRVTLTGRIFPTVRIASTNADCPRRFQEWSLAARAKLEATGVSLAGYTHFFYVWPRLAGCGFGGRAAVSSDSVYLNLFPSSWESTTYWVNNWYVATHELGHALGAHHAGVVSCWNAQGVRIPLGGSCTERFPYTESYDPFDAMVTYVSGMGAAYSKRLPSVHHRYQMGFLDAAELPRYTAPGTYEVKLNPAEFAGSAVKGITITRPGITGPGERDPLTTRNAPDLCLEWHRPKGWFNNFSSTEAVTNGLLVRLCDPTRGVFAKPTRLIDARPGSLAGAADWRDAPLLVGRTLRDAFSGVRITVVSRTINATTPARSTLVVRIVIP